MYRCRHTHTYGQMSICVCSDIVGLGVVQNTQEISYLHQTEGKEGQFIPCAVTLCSCRLKQNSSTKMYKWSSILEALIHTLNHISWNYLSLHEKSWQTLHHFTNGQVGRFRHLPQDKGIGSEGRLRRSPLVNQSKEMQQLELHSVKNQLRKYYRIPGWICPNLNPCTFIEIVEV